MLVFLVMSLAVLLAVCALGLALATAARWIAGSVIDGDCCDD